MIFSSGVNVDTEKVSFLNQTSGSCYKLTFNKVFGKITAQPHTLIIHASLSYLPCYENELQESLSHKMHDCIIINVWGCVEILPSFFSKTIVLDSDPYKRYCFRALTSFQASHAPFCHTFSINM